MSASLAVNSILALYLVYRTLDTLKNGDGGQTRKFLCAWAVLALFLLIEEWLNYGLPTKLILMATFLGDDGSLSQMLVDQSLLPRLDQLHRIIRPIVSKWSEPVKAYLLYYFSWIIYKWNLCSGQIREGDVLTIKRD